LHCDTCGTDEAYRAHLNEYGWVCNVCAHIPSLWMPDVFVGSKGGIQTDDQLVEPGTNDSIPFSSKREKAIILKRLGLKQSILAEHNHGGRNEEYLHRKKYFI